ncbi:hypothetical protein T03_8066 [Trichinella britovi]|uniref:Uncharacterized protein n=2 Tax=Trichinella britovi TaxID=45882 RepID=A0A0V1C9T9_TRIBR|nr:hypothetical protein T03_8066 [Trichinella britovi]
MTAACKPFPYTLARARTQRQVITFDKSLSAINRSALPEISRCMIAFHALSTKCWRQNLIRFLVCGLYKSQDDQLSYDYPMSIVSRS